MALPIPELPPFAIAIDFQLNAEGYDPTRIVVSPAMTRKLVVWLAGQGDKYDGLTDLFKKHTDATLLSPVDAQVEDAPDPEIVAAEEALAALKLSKKIKPFIEE